MGEFIIPFANRISAIDVHVNKSKLYLVDRNKNVFAVNLEGNNYEEVWQIYFWLKTTTTTFYYVTFSCTRLTLWS